VNGLSYRGRFIFILRNFQERDAARDFTVPAEQPRTAAMSGKERLKKRSWMISRCFSGSISIHRFSWMAASFCAAVSAGEGSDDEFSHVADVVPCFGEPQPGQRGRTGAGAAGGFLMTMQKNGIKQVESRQVWL